jgi:hypothetical protein
MNHLYEKVSDDLKKKALEKFKSENPNFKDEQIMYYIDHFDRYHENPRIKEKDILKYKFSQLETLMDTFAPPVTKVRQMNTAEIQGNAIYNKDGIEVYLGDDRHKCVTYKHYFIDQTKTDSEYSWCIARDDASNLFNNYRYGVGYDSPRIFYFVIDRNLPNSDPNHVFVVHVFDDEKYGYTSANNEGDSTDLDWDELCDEAPSLKDHNVPASIFKPKSLTAEEQYLFALTQNKVTSDDLDGHFKGNYKILKTYIEVHGHTLTDGQIKSLMDGGKRDLINLYLVTGGTLELKTLEWIPDREKKTYANVALKIYKETEEFQAFSQLEVLKRLNMVPTNLEQDVYLHMGNNKAKAEALNYLRGDDYYALAYNFGYGGLPKNITLAHTKDGRKVFTDYHGKEHTDDIPMSIAMNTSTIATILNVKNPHNTYKCHADFNTGPTSHMSLNPGRIGVISINDIPYMFNIKMEKSVEGIDVDKLTGVRPSDNLYRAAYLNSVGGGEYTAALPFGQTVRKNRNITAATKEFSPILTGIITDWYFVNKQGKLDLEGVDLEDLSENLKPGYVRQISTLPIESINMFGSLLNNNKGFAIAKLNDGLDVIVNKQGKLDVGDFSSWDLKHANAQTAYSNTVGMIKHGQLQEAFNRMKQLITYRSS